MFISSHNLWGSGSCAGCRAHGGVSGMGVLLGDFVVGGVLMKVVCQWSLDLLQKALNETAFFWLGHLSSCALSDSKAQST